MIYLKQKLYRSTFFIKSMPHKMSPNYISLYKSMTQKMGHEVLGVYKISKYASQDSPLSGHLLPSTLNF